jgi:hypothetical protein
MDTVWALAGNVYVVEALPLLAVVATGVPKVPPAPPSLKVTLTPEVATPFFVALTVRCVGNVVPAFPV